jgi:ribosomal protein L40E
LPNEEDGDLRTSGGHLCSIWVMAETMRCPNCGALNRADAQWCNQCLERFVKPDAEPAAPGRGPAPPLEVVEDPLGTPIDVGLPFDREAGRAPGEPAAESASPTSTITPPPQAVGTERGAFRVKEDGVVWVCSRCEAENALEVEACRVCGSTFAETVRPKVERPERDPGTAALLSLFIPGAGHAYVGLWGQGIARAVVSIWVIVVLLVSFLQRGDPGASLIAVVFGLVAFALWGVAAHDAYREARREETLVLLKGRAFLYLVLGLLVLLLILLTVAGVRA